MRSQSIGTTRISGVCVCVRARARVCVETRGISLRTSASNILPHIYICTHTCHLLRNLSFNVYSLGRVELRDFVIDLFTEGCGQVEAGHWQVA